VTYLIGSGGNLFVNNVQLGVPPDQSDGPDMHNQKPLCYRHHRNDRSGIADYGCCCNPCSYRSYQDSAAGTATHCCRCYPKILVATFIPSGDNECCISEYAPMVGGFVGTAGVSIHGATYIAYSTSIVNNDLTITNSPFSKYQQAIIDSEEDIPEEYKTPLERSCWWWVDSTSLGVDEEYEIDHFNTTCLAPPSFQVDNVVAFDNCTGSISVRVFNSEKVPFQSRIEEFDNYYNNASAASNPPTGLPITFPVSGILLNQNINIYNSSTLLWESNIVDIGPIPRNTANYSGVIPRVLCVDGATRGLCSQSNPIAKHNEFVIDYEYMGYNFDGTIYDSGNDNRIHLTNESGIVLARWRKNVKGVKTRGYRYNESSQTWEPYTEEYADEYIYLMEMQYERDLYGYSPEYDDVYWNDYIGEIGTATYYRYQARPGFCTDSGAGVDYPQYETTAGATALFWDTNGEYFHNHPDYPTWVDDIFGCSFPDTKLPNRRSFRGYHPDTPVGLQYQVNFRSGRCSTFKYYCGSCRCIPQSLCGIAYIGGTVYTNIQFSWDQSTKSWISGSVISYDGYDLGDTLTIELNESSLDQPCTATLDVYGYTFQPQTVVCDELTLNMTFADWSSDPPFWLFVNPSLADCDFFLACNEASPCGGQCGNHPPVVFLTITCGNDEYLASQLGCSFEPTEYLNTGGCTITVPMSYQESYAFVGPPNFFEPTCGYVGFYTATCPYSTTIWKFQLGFGEDPGGLVIEIFDGTRWSVYDIITLDENVTCNPYYASKGYCNLLQDGIGCCIGTAQTCFLEVSE